MPSITDVEVGLQIPAVSETIDQERLLRYAGASGDYNRLHWDPDFAKDVSPTGGVIAHGMLSMGLVANAVSRWAGGPERVTSISASFRAPCPVGAVLHTGGEVIGVDAETRTATLAIWAVLDDGSKVVDRRASRAVVQLD